MRVWVAWDLHDSNGEKSLVEAGQLGRSLQAGSCTERSEPLKPYLLNLSDELAQVIHSQNIKFQSDEVKFARFREDGRVGGQKGDGKHSSSPWRENQVVRDAEKVAPNTLLAAIYRVVEMEFHKEERRWQDH